MLNFVRQAHGYWLGSFLGPLEIILLYSILMFWSVYFIFLERLLNQNKASTTFYGKDIFLAKNADWNIAAIFRYETYWEPLGSLGA